MRDSRPRDHGRTQRKDGSPGPNGITSTLRWAIAVISTIVALGFAAPPSLASTGSVYYDALHNVGAGHNFFNGTSNGLDNVGLGYSVMPSLTTGSFNVASGI